MSLAFLKKYWSNAKAKAFEKEIIALHQKASMSYAEYYRKWKENQDLWPTTSLTRKQIIANFIFGLTGEEQEKLTWTAGKGLELLTNDEMMALLEKVYETRSVQEREKKGLNEIGTMTA